MTRPAQDARLHAQSIWLGATVYSRQRGGITHRHPANFNRFMQDVQCGGIGWHFGAGYLNEVDTAWVGASNYHQPYLQMMGQAEYEAFLFPGNDTIDTANIAQYRDPETGESVSFTLQALQFTNELSQIQQIAIPGNVSPYSIVDDAVRWNGVFGTGLDFIWEAQTARLAKQLVIADFSYLPTLTLGGNVELVKQFFFQPSDNLDIYVNDVMWDQGNNFIEAFGNVEFRHAISGNPLWWFRHPYAWDAGGKAAQTRMLLRKQGNNLLVQVRVPYAWLQSAIYPVVVDPTIDPQVGAGANDTERGSVTGWDNNAVNNSLGFQDPPDQVWGNSYRWTGCTFSGTINSDSYFQLASATTQANDLYLTGALHDIDNPFAPGSSTDFDEQSGVLTSVGWNWTVGTTNWSTDVFYSSPSIQGDLQELVDTYTINNDAVQLYVLDNGSQSYRMIRCYEASSSKGAKLHVDYTTGGGEALNVNVDPSNFGGPGWQHGLDLY